MGTPGCRMAILGLQHWYSALAFLPSFASEPRIEIAGIAHEDVDRARQVASEFGIGRVVEDPGGLIADPSIDAVAVFASTDRNPRLCAAAARAGKHVLGIKPLARTLAEASEVVAAVRTAGVQFLPTEAVGMNGRRGPVELLRSLVADGRLGEIAFARCSVSAGLPQSWPDAQEPGWFADPSRCAGGGWIDHAIYQVDRLRWVLGDEVDSVLGEVATARHTDLEVEDWGAALVRFRGGVLAELRADWLMPTGSLYQDQIEIAGDRGVARIDIVAHRLQLAELPAAGAPLDRWTEFAVPANYSGASVAAHVADVFTGHASPLADVEDAWRNLATAVAFYDAVKSRSTVRVQEVHEP